MTPAGTLLKTAKAHGIDLWAEGPARRYRGNPETIGRLLPELRAHKPELLRLLAGAPVAEPEPPPADPLPILPPPWGAIRDRIQAGWRAEFGPPDAEGRQVITWREPGHWRREAEAAPLPPNATTGTRAAGAGMSGPVRCLDCHHQEPTDHPALVHCRAGEPSGTPAGAWWNTDRHPCGRFEQEAPAGQQKALFNRAMAKTLQAGHY